MVASLFFFYGIVFVPVTRSQIREYHFINTNLTWTAARQYCRERYTDLATVERAEDLQDMLVPQGALAWIGLFDDPASWKGSMTTDSNSWKWSATGDRGTSGFMMWLDGQPRYKDANAQCTCTFQGTWIDYNCSASFKAACYNVTSSVKQFVLSNVRLTWPDARDYCRRYYHDLAMIESLAENQAVRNLDLAFIWIGLYREPWRWSDNTNSSFRRWGLSQPNNKNEIEHCVAMGSDLLWGDENCESQLPFICYEASRKQKFFQLKLQSTANLPDLAVSSQIIKAINMKLGINVTDLKTKIINPEGNA